MKARFALFGIWCCLVSVAPSPVAHSATAVPSKTAESLASQVDQLEGMWQAGQRSAYFSRADEIIRQLPYERPDAAQPAGLKLLSAMLAKKIPSPDDASSQAIEVGSADLRAMTMLGRFLAAEVRISTDLEQQKVRLLATLLGRLRTERIPDYVWQEVYLNVRPPPGVRGMAGMSPDAIEDPVAREQYIAARRENSLKGLQNKRQRALEDAEKIVARPIVEHLSHAASSDSEVASTVASSIVQARLTESERNEVLGVQPR